MHEVTVAIADDALPRFEEVVRACQSVGLQVTQQLPTLGLVVGRIEAGQIPALRRIAGVAAVDAARDIELPPPDSDLQ